MATLFSNFSVADEFSPVVVGMQSVLELVLPPDQYRYYTERVTRELELPCVTFNYQSSDIGGYANQEFQTNSKWLVTIFLRAQNDGSDEIVARSLVTPLVRAFSLNPDCGGTCVEAAINKSVYGIFGQNEMSYSALQLSISVFNHHTY